VHVILKLFRRCLLSASTSELWITVLTLHTHEVTLRTTLRTLTAAHSAEQPDVLLGDAL
jgi:hypothetical protein